jgi:hypothetical protein
VAAAGGNSLFDALMGGTSGFAGVPGGGGGYSGTGGAAMPTSINPAASTMNYGQPKIDATPSQVTKKGKGRRRRKDVAKMAKRSRGRKRARGKGKGRKRYNIGSNVASNPTVVGGTVTAAQQNPAPFIGDPFIPGAFGL